MAGLLTVGRAGFASGSSGCASCCVAGGCDWPAAAGAAIAARNAQIRTKREQRRVLRRPIRCLNGHAIRTASMLSHICQSTDHTMDGRIKSRLRTKVCIRFRANPSLSKYIGKIFSMRFRAIWRPGCTYKRCKLGWPEKCVPRPQGVSRVMLQSPPYQ